MVKACFLQNLYHILLSYLGQTAAINETPLGLTSKFSKYLFNYTELGHETKKIVCHTILRMRVDPKPPFVHPDFITKNHFTVRALSSSPDILSSVDQNLTHLCSVLLVQYGHDHQPRLLSFPKFSLFVSVWLVFRTRPRNRFDISVKATARRRQ
jgi:hypothetical protein